MKGSVRLGQRYLDGFYSNDWYGGGWVGFLADEEWGNSNMVRAALLATGSSGADCEHHVRGARRRAQLAGRPVLLADLEAELDGTSQSPADTWLAAVHEAGHAVASALLMPGSVMAVSLRGTAEHGGAACKPCPQPTTRPPETCDAIYG